MFSPKINDSLTDNFESESESEFRTPNFGLQSESESDEMAGSEKLWLVTGPHHAMAAALQRVFIIPCVMGHPVKDNKLYVST
jgi:hypothetical protein